MAQNIIMRNYAKTNIDFTMFDFEDYYNRVAELMPDNCRVCEVGIANAASAIFLAEAILNLGKNIERFVLVDNLQYGGNDQAQTIINHIIQSGIKEFEFLQMGSLDASCKFPDGYLDFCFIDASHTFEGTKADVRCWWHCMKDGAILAGHDAAMVEVKQAIEEVIPKDQLRIIETTKSYGIWELVKDYEIKMN